MMIKHPDCRGPVGLGSDLDCGLPLDLIAHLLLAAGGKKCNFVEGRLWSDKNWRFESNTLKKLCLRKDLSNFNKMYPLGVYPTVWLDIRFTKQLLHPLPALH